MSKELWRDGPPSAFWIPAIKEIRRYGHVTKMLFSLRCHTESPTQNPYNRTLSPARRDELAKIRQRQLANAVHYIWETGEDKFAFRYFHTGFWESCEKHSDGETTKFQSLLSIKYFHSNSKNNVC